jgi:hypothetical protein
MAPPGSREDATEDSSSRPKSPQIREEPNKEASCSRTYRLRRPGARVRRQAT